MTEDFAAVEYHTGSAQMSFTLFLWKLSLFKLTMNGVTFSRRQSSLIASVLVILVIDFNRLDEFSIHHYVPTEQLTPVSLPPSGLK